MFEVRAVGTSPTSQHTLARKTLRSVLVSQVEEPVGRQIVEAHLCEGVTSIAESFPGFMLFYLEMLQFYFEVLR